MSATTSTQRKFSILKWVQHKKKRIPITVMTAYDYTSAKLVERAEIDAILVGDSVNMVVLGHDSTVSLTMDEMLHHCRAVARGASRPFLIGDMPFMSYNVDVRETVRNAGRFLKEGGMDAVKVEGGQRTANAIRAIVQAGIPVMGHIGLTPQTTSQLGGFRVQGRTAKKAYQLVQDALAVQEAGCFAVVVEGVPAVLADYITQLLDIPTIGIGAGTSCDGQVLVFHDALGIFDDFQPKFVKHFAHIGAGITAGLSDYAAEVRQRTFPTEEHSYTMKDEAWAELLKILEKEEE